MDRDTFDSLTYKLGTSTSRRATLKLLSVTAAGGLLSYLGVGCGSTAPPPVNKDGAALTNASIPPQNLTYGLGTSGTEAAVEFKAYAYAEDKAVAVYRAGAEELIVKVGGENGEIANIFWKGAGAIGHVAISGYGDVDAKQKSAILELGRSPIVKALSIVPFKLACVGGNFQPIVLAALLFPFQVVLKFLTQDIALDVRSAASNSLCNFFADRSGAYGDKLPPPVLPIVSNDDHFPNVYGYFALDSIGVGSIIPLSLVQFRIFENQDAYVPLITPFRDPPESPRGPEDPYCKAGDDTCAPAICRGACGVNCPEKNCGKPSEVYRCVRDDKEDFDGTKQLWLIYNCASHDGCRVHDACFDDCNEIWFNWLGPKNEAQLNNAICHMKCNLECKNKYGVAECVKWAFGGGIVDRYDRYEYKSLKPTEIDTSMCPTCFAPSTTCGNGCCKPDQDCVNNACVTKCAPLEVRCSDGKCCYDLKVSGGPCQCTGSDKCIRINQAGQLYCRP